MLKATQPANRYWNGKTFVCFENGLYEPADEDEKAALLKCQGIVEVEPKAAEPKAPLLALPKKRRKA